MDNVQIGLYYSDKDDQIDDMKLFSADQCQSGVPHCTSGDGFVQIMAASAQFLTLNLVPADLSKGPMAATVNYRLINK